MAGAIIVLMSAYTVPHPLFMFYMAVMSGQFLFNNFFPPPTEGASPSPVQVVPWHTQDMSNDNLSINPALCPVISDVRIDGMDCDRVL